MRTLLMLPTLALSALFPLSAWAAKPASSDAEAAIRQQLTRYEQALNSADVDRVMTLLGC